MKRCKLYRTGFTLVEVLISLAISALLMAAVAAAFNAAAMGYQDNRDIYNAINNARQALNRMTTELRTGYHVDANDPNTQCVFNLSDGTSVTYRYVPSDSNLYLIKGTATYTLCENVTDLYFNKSHTGDNGYSKGVQIYMQVQSGSATQNLVAAAAIRRNL